MLEAQRCLNCKNKPCMKGCPVNVAIPDFIKKSSRETRRKPMTSSGRQNPCPPYAAGSARRKPMRKSTASAGIKGEPVAIRKA